jgi:hypothetical protein
MPAENAVRKYAVEKTYADLSRAVLVPAIEYTAKKICILLRRNTKIGNLSSFRIGLDAGDELQKIKFQIDEKIEYLVRLGHILIVDQCEDIKLDVIVFAPLDRCHDPIPGALALIVKPVVVVEFLWSIETYAYEKFVFVKKLAPFIVKQDAVGLQGVGDDLAVFAVFLLELDELFVKIKPHQRRFAPLPCESRFRHIKRNIAADEFVQHFVAHTMTALAENICLAGIKAVLALDVAIRARRFYQ